MRGDLINDRGAKQRTVFESEEPITGVEFRKGSNTTVYISTTGRILTHTITGKGQGQPAKVLEDSGCGVDCMALDEANGEIVVSRDDAIRYYGPNGRGPSFAYEGQKQSLHLFRDYLAVVTIPKAPAIMQSGNLRRFGGSQPHEPIATSSFSLLDPDLKFLAHTQTLTSQVRAVFGEWGDLFILTTDGKLFRYHEKTLQQKLEIFYQRDLYVLAINFAQKAGVNAAQQNVIFRKYGDFLHKKGDYDTAMQQYLKAIDSTEPSQIIRKFLDSQRINNLIEYLEELHDHDKATVDHTTLLLNCYAKLKDTRKLETFIESGTNFDLETAISMCRQGGYFDQAAFLAKKNHEHELVVDTLIENSKNYEEALDYIWRLEASFAYPILMKYARVLLEHCADDTTQLFIEYYRGRYRPKKDEQEDQEIKTNPAANRATFLSLPFGQSAAATASPATTGQIPLSDADETASKKAINEPNYAVPKPRTAFSSFVDHPDEFVEFLETLLEDVNIQNEDKTDIYTTLFELYLETGSIKKGEEKAVWEDKAKTLIESNNVCNPSQWP